MRNSAEAVCCCCGAHLAPAVAFLLLFMSLVNTGLRRLSTPTGKNLQRTQKNPRHPVKGSGELLCFERVERVNHYVTIRLLYQTHTPLNQTAQWSTMPHRTVRTRKHAPTQTGRGTTSGSRDRSFPDFRPCDSTNSTINTNTLLSLELANNLLSGGAVETVRADLPAARL